MYYENLADSRDPYSDDTLHLAANCIIVKRQLRTENRATSGWRDRGRKLAMRVVRARVDKSLCHVEELRILCPLVRRGQID